MAESTNRIPEVLLQASSVLTIVGSTLVMGSIWKEVAVRKRVCTMKFVLMLAYADFLMGVCFAATTPPEPKYDEYCRWLGIFVNMFSVPPVTTTVCLAFVLLWLNGRRDPDAEPGRIAEEQGESKYLFPMSNVLVFGFSLAMTLVIQLIYDPFGRTDVDCWVIGSNSVPRYLLFVPVALGLVFLLVVFVAINARPSADFDARTRQRLSLYMLAQLLTWSMAIANRSYQAVYGNNLFVLTVLQSICEPLQGFLDTLIYALSLPHFKIKIGDTMTMSSESTGLLGHNIKTRTEELPYKGRVHVWLGALAALLAVMLLASILIVRESVLQIAPPFFAVAMRSLFAILFAAIGSIIFKAVTKRWPSAAIVLTPPLENPLTLWENVKAALASAGLLPLPLALIMWGLSFIPLVFVSYMVPFVAGFVLIFISLLADPREYVPHRQSAAVLLCLVGSIVVCASEFVLNVQSLPDHRLLPDQFPLFGVLFVMAGVVIFATSFVYHDRNLKRVSIDRKLLLGFGGAVPLLLLLSLLCELTPILSRGAVPDFGNADTIATNAALFALMGLIDAAVVALFIVPLQLFGALKSSALFFLLPIVCRGFEELLGLRFTFIYLPALVIGIVMVGVGVVTLSLARNEPAYASNRNELYEVVPRNLA